MTDHNQPLDAPKMHDKHEANGAARKEWAPPTLARLADVRGTANTTTYGNADGGPTYPATFS